MLTPEILWFGSSGATSLARGPAQTSSCCAGSDAFLKISAGSIDWDDILTSNCSSCGEPIHR